MCQKKTHPHKSLYISNICLFLMMIQVSKYKNRHIILHVLVRVLRTRKCSINHHMVT